MSGRVYGVDLGTSSIKIYKKGKGIVCNEKNIIAIENRKKVIAIGDSAYEMYEKSPENVDVSFPVRKGVIADIAHMEALFNGFIRKINKGGKAASARYVVAIPTDITEVEKKAFIDLIESSVAKVKDVVVVDKPIAAALGAELDITNARGVMMVDIGAATTEIAILSLGGIVISKLLPIGGETFDEAIATSIKKKCNLFIGNKTAGALKEELGCAYPTADGEKYIYGRNVVTGLPQEINIKSPLIYEAIKESLNAIVDAIKMILERTPPEISSDIIDSGIYISGGSALIRQFAELISEQTELQANICFNPASAVVKGLGRIIEEPALSQLAVDPRKTVRR